MRRSGPRTLCLWLVVAACLAPLSAQIERDFRFSDSFPPADPRGRLTDLPRLTFQVYADIPLPGPLPGDPPRVVEGNHVEIPVAGALAVTALEQGAIPDLRADNTPPEDHAEEGPSDWALSPDGKRRFRTVPPGLLIAEKCCSWWRKRWHKIWKLRIAGGTVAPPLALQGRVFVGALDNQIYALRARNGHRLWTLTVGERVSNPLAVWRGAVLLRGKKKKQQPEPTEIELILVVPDGGSTLLALDAASGRKVTSFELPDSGGKIVGPPVATTDGKVVVALQKYSESEAGLIVLQLEPPDPAPQADDTAEEQLASE